MDIKDYCIEVNNLPEDVKFCCNLLKPDEYIEALKTQGFPVYDDYSDTVFNKCRDATAWSLIKLAAVQKQFMKTIKVMEGRVMGRQHVWLKYKDFYIDITLSQFYPNSPKQSVMKDSVVKDFIYFNCEEYRSIDWINLELERED